MENDALFESRLDLTELRDKIGQLRNQISELVIGQEDFIDQLITALLANGHILIEGVPGIAKTLTAKLLSQSIEAGFSRIQFTPDLMPSDVVGTTVFNVKTSDFEFKPGPIFSNIVLIDEINRAPAKTQSALFESMEERQVSVDGQTYELKPPFIVLATQNPIDQEGTYQLPEAQLDRFVFKIIVNYPSAANEVKILQLHHQGKIQQHANKVKPVLTPDDIRRFQELVRKIHIDNNLLEYIAALINETRNSPHIYLGASPRASIACMQCSKAYAAMQGRDFVTPEDIQVVAYPILRHRMILSSEKELDGSTTDDVIKNLISAIEVPR